MMCSPTSDDSSQKTGDEKNKGHDSAVVSTRLPVVLVMEWLVENASSNVELATLSNVSREWRQLLEGYLVSTAGIKRTDNALLLLPSMLEEIVATDTEDEQNRSTFCAAWFPSEGIQSIVVELGDDDEEEESDAPMDLRYVMAKRPTFHHNNGQPRRSVTRQQDPSSVVCSNEWRGYREAFEVLEPFGYVRSFVEGVIQLAHQRKRADTAAAATASRSMNGEASSPKKLSGNQSQSPSSSRHLTTTYAVRGATYARPEGYCQCWDQEHLLDEDSDAMNERAERLQQHHEREVMRHGHAVNRQTQQLQQQQFSMFNMNGILNNKSSPPPQAPRPTSFPNPLRQPSTHLQQEQQLNPYRLNGSGSPDDRWNGAWQDLASSSSSFHETTGQQQEKRRVQRTILQEDVLPRVLQMRSTDRVLPSVQFLNASGTHATRMFTPPFACGPLEGGPITMLCVGIATEDGCFVSGLKRRCELGHMYPSNPVYELIDKSAVCLATDAGNCGSGTDDDNNDIDDNRTRRRSQPLDIDRNRGHEDQSSDDDDDDESDDLDDEYGYYRDLHRHRSIERVGGHDGCRCPFPPLPSVGVAANGYHRNQHHHVDETSPCPVDHDLIYRGLRGPGAWHCYTAIFDGKYSEVRVDGLTESKEQYHHVSEEEEERIEEESSSKSHRRYPVPILDGLTIGSDHCFDMTLCFGDGSDEEGQGAISELIVFQGRLPPADLERLERHLMQKHGIAYSHFHSPSSSATQLDEWQRQARALIAQPPPYHMITDVHVPLHVIAKDPSVAWHRTHSVTGKRVVVGRIGSKYSTGSSDW